MKIKLSILFFVFVIISNLGAFDGKKEGFLLGLGFGVANVSYEQEISGYGESISSDEENETGFASDFKIGFAPNNKVEIYYSSQVAWFSIKNIYEDNVLIADGVGTLSVSFFLSSKLNSVEWAASPYVSCGYGFSGWSTPSEKNSESWKGSGFFLGCGYEFAKHYRVSINYFNNNPSIHEDGLDYTTNSSAFLFTLSAMAF